MIRKRSVGILALCSFLLFFTSGESQNIVPNPSFESYTQLPNGIGQWNRMTNWMNPNSGSPDFHHALGTGSGSAPSNLWGYQAPRTGQGYAALARNSLGSYHEYLMVQLSQPLVPGSVYYCEMWLSSVDNYYGLGCNNMGFYFTNSPISQSGNTLISASPQVSGTTPVTNTAGWTKVSGSFVASNNAQYLLIGNFSSNSSTNWSWYNTSAIATAMYYVEDILVQFTASLPLDLLEFSVSPNANKFADLNWTSINEKNTGKYEIQRSFDGDTFEKVGEIPAVGNSQSEETYSFQDKPDVYGKAIHYRLKEIDQDGAIHLSAVKTVTFELPEGTQLISLFPNPVTLSNPFALEISHKGDTEKAKIEIFDLQGRMLLEMSQLLQNGHNHIEIETNKLAKGHYILTLTTPSGRLIAHKVAIQ